MAAPRFSVAADTDDEGNRADDQDPLRGRHAAVVKRALPVFERTNGATIDIEFRLTSAHKKAIEDGAAFDVAILPRPELNDLAEHGAIARACTADVARSAVGLAVRAGAPKPDSGSAAALTRALLQARSFAYSDGPAAPMPRPSWENSASPKKCGRKPNSRAGPWRNWLPAAKPKLAHSRSSRLCPSAALARDFIAFGVTDEAKRFIRAFGLEPS